MLKFRILLNKRVYLYWTRDFSWINLVVLKWITINRDLLELLAYLKLAKNIYFYFAGAETPMTAGRGLCFTPVVIDD